MAIFCILHFQRAACSKFQTCILNLHKATPCVEVWQTSNLRPLRLGEEKRKKKEEEETTGRKHNDLPYSIGRPWPWEEEGTTGRKYNGHKPEHIKIWTSQMCYHQPSGSKVGRVQLDTEVYGQCVPHSMTTVRKCANCMHGCITFNRAVQSKRLCRCSFT